MAYDRSGESYKREQYPEIIRDDILDKYKGKNADPLTIEKEIALETYAFRAALYLLDGPEDGIRPAKKKKDEDIIRIDDILNEDNGSFISYDRVKEVADELKKKGILDAAEQDYDYLFKDERKKKTDPVKPVPQEEMKYEGFLYKTIDKLHVSGDIDAPLRKAQAKNAMENRSMTYREYWDYKCPDRGILAAPYRNENVSTYEYEAPESSWRLFASMAHVLKGDGGKLMSRDEVDRVKELPFPKLALRNKQTVEKLNRGDKEGMALAVQETQKNFTFQSDEELKQMQEEADRIEGEMRRMSLKATASQDWRDLRFAMQKFSASKTKEEAAKHSAEILIAVEKFTKGRKSEQDDQTQPCVDKALEALSACVPDARNNPSVQPLVNRFNQVRGWHPFQKPIALRDYHTVSELTAEKRKAANIIEKEPEEEELNPLDTGFIDYGNKIMKENRANRKEPNLFS